MAPPCPWIYFYLFFLTCYLKVEVGTFSTFDSKFFLTSDLLEKSSRLLKFSQKISASDLTSTSGSFFIFSSSIPSFQLPKCRSQPTQIKPNKITTIARLKIIADHDPYKFSPPIIDAPFELAPFSLFVCQALSKITLKLTSVKAPMLGERNVPLWVCRAVNGIWTCWRGESVINNHE